MYIMLNYGLGDLLDKPLLAVTAQRCWAPAINSEPAKVRSFNSLAALSLLYQCVVRLYCDVFSLTKAVSFDIETWHFWTAG
jgi:hypothetical protein